MEDHLQSTKHGPAKSVLPVVAAVATLALIQGAAAAAVVVAETVANDVVVEAGNGAIVKETVTDFNSRSTLFGLQDEAVHAVFTGTGSFICHLIN